MINVTIIGFGNVGSTLALLLLNNKRKLRINIIDPDDQYSGAFLDLEHGLSLFQNKELQINNTDLIENADFIFYTAGTPNLPGGSRLSMAKQNVDLTKTIFEPLNFTGTPFVFIITNPVDIVSHAVYKYSGLPKEHIIGTGTFLDSMRLSYYLSSVSKYKMEDFESLILGEHGSSQVPIFSNTKVNGIPILQNSTFTTNDLNKVQILTETAAAEIRKTQLGTKYAVSKCAEMLFEYALDKSEINLAASMLTNEHYRSLLNLDNDIYISLPVTIKDGKFTINNDMKFSVEELTDLRKSASIISENMCN